MMFNPKPNETQSESHSQTSTFNNFIHNIHSIATNGLSEKQNWKAKKLDLPTFDGRNPDGWIIKVERYFHFYSFSEKKWWRQRWLTKKVMRWYGFNGRTNNNPFYGEGARPADQGSLDKFNGHVYYPSKIFIFFTKFISVHYHLKMWYQVVIENCEQKNFMIKFSLSQE